MPLKTPFSAPVLLLSGAATLASTHRPLRASATRYIGAAFFNVSPTATRRSPASLVTGAAAIMSKLDSPSAERNKYPIWKVLESKVAPTLSEGAQILEIASGAGVHTQFFSMQLMQLRRSTFKWYPSDTSESYMASTRAYVQDDPTLTDDIVVTPTKLTLNEYGIVEVETVNLFADLTFDLILNINMIHISPWEATLGLMNVAGEKLRPGGFLFLYGPYKVGGTCVESNRNFDVSLRQRDPQWGIRDLETVVEVAEQNGLTFLERIEMPANNLVLLFRKG